MFSLVVFTLLLSEARAAHQFASTHHLRKRFGGDATYYDVGLGACGGTNVASDFVVALNAPQFDEAGTKYPNPSCGRTLTISHNGKTAQAVVVDKCPGCGYGSLDMSQGLFEFFESTAVGRFGVSWDWGGSAPVSQPTSPPNPAPSPSPSPSPAATTTSAQTRPATNSPSTSSSSSSSSSSSASSSSSSSSSSSAASTPTAQPNNNPYGTGDDKSGLPGNVLVLQEAIVNIGSLIRHAAGQS